MIYKMYILFPLPFLELIHILLLKWSYDKCLLADMVILLNFLFDYISNYYNHMLHAKINKLSVISQHVSMSPLRKTQSHPVLT